MSWFFVVGESLEGEDGPDDRVAERADHAPEEAEGLEDECHEDEEQSGAEVHGEGLAGGVLGLVVEDDGGEDGSDEDEVDEGEGGVLPHGCWSCILVVLY